MAGKPAPARSEAPVPIDEDCLRPRTGKFDFSEQPEVASRTPRPRKVDAKAGIENDDEPTSWSKYDGFLGATARPTAEPSPSPDADIDWAGEDKYCWTKYDQPARPMMVARADETGPTIPAGEAPAAAPVPAMAAVEAVPAEAELLAEPPASELAPSRELSAIAASGIPEACDLAALTVEASLEALYAAALLDGQGGLASLPKLQLSFAMAEIAPAPSTISTPLPLSLSDGAAEAHTRAAAKPAFDPLLALASPSEATPQPTNSADRKKPSLELAPPVLSMTAPEFLLVDAAPAASIRTDELGNFGDLSSLASLQSPGDFEFETTLGPVVLAMPRSFAPVENGTTRSVSTAAFAAAPVRAPIEPRAPLPPKQAPRVSATRALGFAATDLLSQWEPFREIANLSALPTLSLDLEIESAATVPARLALPAPMMLLQGETERQWGVAFAFDPLLALGEPSAALPPVAASPPKQRTPEVLAFSAPLSLIDDRRARAVAAWTRRTEATAEFAGWAELPRLATAIVINLEPEAPPAAFAASELWSVAGAEPELSAPEPYAAIDPFLALAEPAVALEPVRDAPNMLAPEPQAIELPAESTALAEGLEAEEAQAQVPDFAPLPILEAVEPPSFSEPRLQSDATAAISELMAQAPLLFATEVPVETATIEPETGLAAEADAELAPAKKTAAEESDPEAEKRAAIDALSKQLSSVVGSVLESKEFAVLANRRPRSSSDPGIGRRISPASRAAAPTMVKGGVGRPAGVESASQKPRAGRRWFGASIAAALSTLVVASGYLALEPGETPSADAPLARNQVAALSSGELARAEALPISNLHQVSD